MSLWRRMLQFLLPRRRALFRVEAIGSEAEEREHLRRSSVGMEIAAQQLLETSDRFTALVRDMRERNR